VTSVECLRQGCPIFTERGPLKENISWRGLHWKLYIELGVTASVFLNNFILNSYESLHNKVRIVTAGCMFCSMCI